MRKHELMIALTKTCNLDPPLRRGTGRVACTLFLCHVDKMGKSDAKKFLAPLVGEEGGITCGDSGDPAWLDEIDVVAEDCSVEFRSTAYQLGSRSRAASLVSGNDIIKLVTRRAVQYLKRPNVLVYCLICDKPSFVTESKLPEQRERDKQGGGVAEALAATEAVDRYFPENVELSLETTAPGAAWGCCLNHRGTRQRFVRFIMANVMQAIPVFVLGSKMLIVDFEGEAGKSVAMRYTAKGATAIPGNEVGEFDLSWLSWRRSLTEMLGPRKMLLCTIDTDLMMIGMLYAARTGRDDVFVLLDGKSPSTTMYIDTRACVRSLQDHLRGPDEMSTVLGLVQASVTAGSDFTRGWPGIGHTTMLKAFVTRMREPAARRCMPTTQQILKTAQGLSKGGKRKRTGSSSGDNGLPARHYDFEYARTLFTLKYWCEHLSGRPDVVVCPFKTYGDATCPGWLPHSELTIVENR